MMNETELQKLIENYCADMLEQQEEEAERYYHKISGDFGYKMVEIDYNLNTINWDRLEFSNWVAVPSIELPSIDLPPKKYAWDAASIEDVREAGLGLAFYHVDEDEKIDSDVFYMMDYLSNEDNSERIKKCIKALENYPKEAQ
ncbi:hypothetical protein L2475_02155 [Lactobacillus gasseri]|nr:hypothetical protein [Lactobacillus gasseri]